MISSLSLSLYRVIFLNRNENEKQKSTERGQTLDAFICILSNKLNFKFSSLSFFLRVALVV